MSENRTQLTDMADALFAELRGAEEATVRGRIEQAGFGLLLVSEEQGGFGGDWGDVAAVMRLAGLHALAAPLGEHIVAAHAQAAGVFSGDDPVWDLAAYPGDRIAMIAFLRVCQTAGALDGALALAIEYCGQRVQFGRPLSKFQAVQQNIALLACEAAAVNCAALGAAAALDRGDAAFEIAAAKLRANTAIKTGTALAHQVHGAIGFTREYPLNDLTRAMMGWRSEGGNDAYWTARIGRLAIAWGGAGLWEEMTRRTDPQSA
jgi:alkylation response protein AidB-like acyl-CoA dehydrogenase